MSPPDDANAARRTAILDAAVPIFLRYGFKKTSMDDLARAAGLSRQGLYLHFPTKELLFKEGLERLIASTRDKSRAALARDDDDVEARLLDAIEAVHGHGIGQSDAEAMTELFETAKVLLGPAVTDVEEALVTDLVRALRTSGVAALWKDEGVSAKELADNLVAASYGTKHRVATAAEYRDRMRVAIRIACRGKRR